jgi:hypothetical protein
VPHFEKMLYDQGQLAVSYSYAYLLTKDESYADIVRDILLYVSRDLSHPVSEICDLLNIGVKSKPSGGPILGSRLYLEYFLVN